MPVRDCRFLVDRHSHVSLHFGPRQQLFWNQALINAARIAIWNRNKVAIVLAMTVWVLSIGFHLNSKSHPFVPSSEDLKSNNKCVLIIDIVRVNVQFDLI